MADMFATEGYTTQHGCTACGFCLLPGPWAMVESSRQSPDPFHSRVRHTPRKQFSPLCNAGGPAQALGLKPESETNRAE